MPQNKHKKHREKQKKAGFVELRWYVPRPCVQDIKTAGQKIIDKYRGG